MSKVEIVKMGILFSLRMVETFAMIPIRDKSITPSILRILQWSSIFMSFSKIKSGGLHMMESSSEVLVTEQKSESYTHPGIGESLLNL